MEDIFDNKDMPTPAGKAFTHAITSPTGASTKHASIFGTPEKKPDKGDILSRTADMRKVASGDYFLMVQQDRSVFN